jgi:hypothetical protein
MRTDAEFTADMDRAARALRAAAAGALSSGIAPEDMARIMLAGITDASAWVATHEFRARADDIGYVPTGEPLPDRPAPASTVPTGGHGKPGDWDFRPPPVHFAVGGTRAA